MKRLVVALLAALSFNALAVSPTALITPSPLGVVIAIKSYLKDQKKAYYIRVESQARDFEQAKKQAFRLASEQVAGTVVLSESELRNSKLTRDEIITYSSGLIDEYKIVDRVDMPDQVKLTVDIWIVESVLAQRLLAKSATDRGVDGNSFSTRVGSILEERQRGDQVIWAVLRDMPRHGFVVTLGKPQIKMGADRNTVIVVRSELRWDDRYINAFTEAAWSVGLKPQPLCWSNCPNIQYTLNGAGFEDSQKLTTVLDYVRQSQLVLKVELQNSNGQAMARVCGPLNLLQEQSKAENPMIYARGNSVAVGNKNAVVFDNTFFVGQNTTAMAQMHEFRAEVVIQSQCRSF
jgi:hypothetical protein